MVMQSTLRSSIAAALSFVFDDTKEEVSCDWIPSDETWQKCPKCNGCHWDACRESISSTREEKESDTDSQFLVHPRTCFKSPATNNRCAGSAPNLVYRRRKPQSNSIALVSAKATVSKMENGGALSRMNSKGDHCSSQMHNEVDSAGASAMAGRVHNVLSDGNASVSRSSYLHKSNDVPCTKLKKARDMETLLKFDSVNDFSGGEENGFDKAPKAKKTFKSEILNDTLSSSKSNMELGSVSTKAVRDGNGECSSSSVYPEECLSEKELCISVLRCHGIIEKALPIRSCSPNDSLSIHGSKTCSQSCKICGRLENPMNMLICDNCEDAYHVTCWNTRKKVPVGDWYCQRCTRKEHKSSWNFIEDTSVNAQSEESSCRNGASKGGANLIALMLKDRESYTTGVRIGRTFQAEVSDWSGPIIEDFDCFGEPLEFDPTEYGSLRGWNMNDRSFTPKSYSNWLQCRYKLDASAGEHVGTICGKWRRAPLFEVQTDEWDCSCAVIWDPVHADCAVPQEMETDQILMHVKYIELLRHRLLGKKRKVSPSGSETQNF